MSWDQQTLLLRQKKKKFWIDIQYVWAPLLRPCESHEQSIFSWQIMFTSKFKNTHPHLEEMPSRFSCDLSGHICGQYCLACGQLSFYCFISTSVCRNNSSGPSAASALNMRTCTYWNACGHLDMHTLYTTNTHITDMFGLLCIHAYAVCVQPCAQHTLMAWSNNI